MFGQFTLTFHWYGLIVGIAASLVWWLVTDLGKKYDLPLRLTQRWWLVVLGSLVGARAWHLVTDWSVYWPDLVVGQWWQILAVWQGGLSILGAVVAALILIKWLSGKAWLKAFDILALALPFGQAVGRLANWVNQELYGLPTDLPWGIKIDLNHRLPTLLDLAQTTKFHPLFAYEAIGLLILAGFLWKFKASFKTWEPGNAKLFMLYLTGYSWLRFGLDFLRPDPGLVWQGLGFNQWVLLMVGTMGMVFWLGQFGKLRAVFQRIKTSHKLPYLWPILVLVGLLAWFAQTGFNRQSQSQHQTNLNSALAKTSDRSEVFVVWQRRNLWGEEELFGETLKLTLAKTDRSRATGLGGISQLPNDGMLFWFDRPAKWQFWMKGMNFGLDFIWLMNGEVVEITPQVLPPSSVVTQQALPVLQPSQDINQVIELSSGRVEELGIKLGDRILFQN